MPFIAYPGLNPSNAPKDAKYSVRSSSSGGMVVRLVYRLSVGERALLTTEDHDELVEMVNRAKVELNGQPGGAFYINEYFHVLVPGQGAMGCVYAGSYERLLQFDCDGAVISPHPPAGLAPGDPWPGPHVGIKYTLAAGGTDIYYKQMSTPGREKSIFLSSVCGAGPAAELARRLAAIKGSSGGVFYINEAGEFFAPVGNGGALSYLYLGPLEDSPWFPLPDVPDV